MVNEYCQSEGTGSTAQISSEQWAEIRKENRREYLQQYRNDHPEYSYKRKLSQNPVKLGNIIPISNYEWKRKTILYPAPPDERGLIDLSQYKKSNR